MGNCQAIDAATLVIQHPCGKVDKFYWPVSASEIMRMNPGHYVALLISTTLYPTPTLTNNTNKEEFPNNNNSSSSNNNNSSSNNNNSSSSNNNNNSNSNSNSNNNNINKGNSVRLTRIKLLRPTDTLVLGQVYRLITTQEVMKGLSAKKHAKMNGNRPQSAEKPERANEKPRRSELDKDNQVMKHERHRPRTTTSSTNSFAARSRMWQPSLQSISEAGS